VILVWALIYWCGGLLTDAEVEFTLKQSHLVHKEEATTTVSSTNKATITRGFGHSLYFTIVTFTTLGYGDIRPRPNCMMRSAAAVEALAGAAIMALFIVSLTRRFAR
jgi:hypothetical protein